MRPTVRQSPAARSKWAAPRGIAGFSPAARTPHPAVRQGACMTATRETTLAEVAARNGGFFSVEDARAAGISDRTRGRRIHDGLWVPVQPRLYRHRSAVLDWRTELRAACRSSPRFVIAGRAAAALHGLPGPSAQVVEGIIRGGGQPRLRSAHLHRTARLWASEVIERDGLRVTCVERTALDVACTLARDDRIAYVDDVVSGRCTTAPRLHRAASRWVRRRGVLHVVAEVTHPEAPVHFRSWLERTAADVFRRAGVPPPAWNQRLRLADGRAVEPDCLWQAARLVVELDGLRFHSTDHQRGRDQARQNALVLAGYRVLRFTWRDVVHEPERVARDILLALGAPR